MNHSDKESASSPECFDKEKVRHVQKLFTDITGCSSVFLSLHGTLLTQPIMSDAITAEWLDAATSILVQKTPPDQQTMEKNLPRRQFGIWKAAIPVFHNNAHIAYWQIGLVRSHDVRQHDLESLCLATGKDEESLRNFINSLPAADETLFGKYEEMLRITAREVTTFVSSEDHLDTDDLITYDQNSRLLFEMNQAGIYRSTIGGRLLDCNERFAKILGYNSPQEIKGYPTSILYFTTGDRLEFLDRLRISGQLNNSELLMKSKQGEEVWILENVILTRDVKTGEELIQGTCVDITYRKNIEKALRQSEAKYRMLVENAFDGIYLMHGRKYEYVNSRFTEITGYTFDEASSAEFDIGLLLTENSRKVVEERYEARKRGEKIPGQYEIEIRSKNGEIKYVRLSTVSMSEGDEVIVTGIMHDVTEPHKMAVALWESEERLKLAVKSANLGLWDKDYQTDKIVRSDNWAEMLGYHPAEIDQSKDSFFEMVHPDDVALVKQAIEDHDSGKTDHLTIAHRMKNKQGEWKWILNVGSIVGRDKNGRPLRALGIHMDIDGLKKAEEALSLSKATYQGIINSVSDAIYIQDIEGKFLYVNKAAAQMYNYSKEELIGKSPEFLSATGKNDLQEISNKIRKAYHGEHQNLEFWGKRKNDEVFLKEVNLTAGEFFGERVVLATARDITDRKKTEEDLKDSKNRYRAFINSTEDMIFIKDENLRYILSNQKNLEFFNLDKEEDILHKTDFDLMPVEMARKCKESDLKALENNRINIQVERMKDRIFETRKFPLKLKGGKTGVGGFIRDITERKITDDKIKSNEKFQTLLNEITIKAIDTRENDDLFQVIPGQIKKLFDADHCCITLWNDRNQIAIFCAPASTDQEFNQAVMCGKDLQKMTEIVIRTEKVELIRSVSNSQFTKTFLAENLPAESVIILPMVAGERKLGAIVLTFREQQDFTDETINRGEIVSKQISLVVDKMKMMEELKKNEKRLQRSNNEKDKFFSIIAHDIKSPFSSFLGLTEIMADDFDQFTLKEIQHFIVTMRDSASNLYRLLENLLEWSRIQQGFMQFKPEMIPLTEVVNNSTELIQNAAYNKEIEINHDIPENFMVFADTHMIETIIRNLISNALKYTPKGGNLSVSAAYAADGSAIITVTDTGIGMSDEIIENLFRVDVNTSRKGTNGEPSTGLGLILCKEFIEKHAGKIDVKSVPGKGSSFIITLPPETR